MGILRPESLAGIPVRSRAARITVVYEHALLGEGIARLVRSATGAEVVAVPGDDARALAGALAAGPWVVLVERGPLLDELDLAVAAPAAAVIDLTLYRGVRDPLRRKPIGVTEMIDAVIVAMAHRSRRTCGGGSA